MLASVQGTQGKVVSVQVIGSLKVYVGKCCRFPGSSGRCGRLPGFWLNSSEQLDLTHMHKLLALMKEYLLFQVDQIWARARAPTLQGLLGPPRIKKVSFQKHIRRQERRCGPGWNIFRTD